MKTIWKQDGNLIYSLNDLNTNHNEIVVTMADGKRGLEERGNLAELIFTLLMATELFCNRDE